MSSINKLLIIISVLVFIMSTIACNKNKIVLFSENEPEEKYTRVYRFIGGQ